MSYLVLARKWRPRSFDTLVGQDHVVRALTHALSTQRLHHAWLFTGTRGVGKTTLSRILAKSLNCETGITATPCGVCRACTEIDSGRFVDYVELDAASNRGVDEMTQLLEQAVYSPGAGRFKVYMIDEVHMLTGHAFNAMLKTLEEPPPHVKFILATTDPQKIPVTVLSRCLQFNLKQMTGESIVEHLRSVLQQESIPFEIPALRLIGQAAAGSMRDALSLTDQAIAYSAGNLTAESVQGMLGTIDQRHLIDLLGALSAGDAAKVIAVADDLAARGLSYSGALADLAVLLSRIAMAQRLGRAVPDDDPAAEDILALGRTMHPDQVQLFYSVAVHSRQELSLAPDEYAGFVMACLRMLALGPNPGMPLLQGGGGARASAPAAEAVAAATAVSPPPVAAASVATTKETYDAAPGGAASAGQGIAEPPPRAPEHRGAEAQAAASSANAEPPAWEDVPDDGAPPAEWTSAGQAAAQALQSSPAEKAGREVPAVASRNDAARGSSDLSPAVEVSSEPARQQPPQADGEAFESPVAAQAQAESNARAQAEDGAPEVDDIPIELDGNFEMVGLDDDEFIAQAPMDEMAGAMALPSLGGRRKGKSGQAELSSMTTERWPALAAKLPVTGIAAELAKQSEWIGSKDNQVRLRVAVRSLTQKQIQGRARLQTVLSEHFGCVVDLQVEFGATGDETAHAVAQAERAARQKQAEHDAEADPFVQALIRDFGARILPGSVQAIMPST
ncbi:DNA polymerase III subunit gamma/tau [Paracandidimonas soli]|uniref:DNA polymerase III subunit gamma/tau n=1 Tax=Paracandidimonas soli TaxID=1917182 RepID=UPI00333ED04B